MGKVFLDATLRNNTKITSKSYMFSIVLYKKRNNFTGFNNASEILLMNPGGCNEQYY